jgi:hypothetical protein
VSSGREGDAPTWHQRTAPDRKRLYEALRAVGLCVDCGVLPVFDNGKRHVRCKACLRANAARQRKTRKKREGS